MKLVSTTLARNNEDIIGDALKSVLGFVDQCIVIDTGSTDRTIEAALEATDGTALVTKVAWRNDFSFARNAALQIATEQGADWAMTLDTDERFICRTNVSTYVAWLCTTEDDTALVMHDSLTYSKERLFRLPAKGKWVGPTHECYVPGQPGRDPVPGVLMSELDKTPEQLKAKFERDRVALEQHTVANPKDPRWWYYLGATYSDLSDMMPTGEREELRQKAVVRFGRCQQLRGWNEESAWACYRGADMLCKLGQYQEAVEWCAKGLARHAGIPELAWLAAYASWQNQDPEQAVQWAHMAIPNGLFIAGRTDYPGRFRAKRIGFRNPGALWEGPFDILRFALRKVGDNEGANAAEELYREALRQRTTPQS